MANFDLVCAYTEEDASWFEKQGYPHPTVRQGNEMPTSADMKWALEKEELSFEYPREEQELYGKNADGWWFSIDGFDWEANNTTPGKYFTTRGFQVILPVLIRLCGRCGQLLVYPDTGDPAVVLDANLDAEAVTELYNEAVKREDAWPYFFEKMYGRHGAEKG